jgi:hypothetical protein
VLLLVARVQRTADVICSFFFSLKVNTPPKKLSHRSMNDIFCNSVILNSIAIVTIRIKDNSNEAKLLLEYIKGFKFVEFIETEIDNSSSKKEAKFLADIEKGFSEVQQIRAGKLNPLSVNDFWDEK